MSALPPKRNLPLLLLVLAIIAGVVALLNKPEARISEADESVVTPPPRTEAKPVLTKEAVSEATPPVQAAAEKAHPADCAHCAAKDPDTMATGGQAEPPILKSRPQFDPIFKKIHRETVLFSRSDFDFLKESELGQQVDFDLAGRTFSGEVALVREGTRAKAYAVSFPEGNLMVTVDTMGAFRAHLMLEGDSRVVEIADRNNRPGKTRADDPPGKISGSGNLVASEVSVSDVVCAPTGAIFPLAAPQPVPISGLREEGAKDLAQPNVPVAAVALTSESDSEHVLYLNFDGEVVTGDAWNVNSGIGTINALPAPRANDDEYVRNIWERVVEDLAPFDIKVTTDRAVYNAADSQNRLQALITPTSDVAPGSGGVAFLNSYATDLSDIVWVFNLTEYAAASTVSHEAGHAFGLSHDGDSNNIYYPGHNGSYAPGWGAIMGAPFRGLNDEVDQWSKGEYNDANNQEDDIAIIANAANGFGFKADDFADIFTGGSGPGVGLLTTSGPEEVSGAGIISERSDKDVFRFSAAFSGLVGMTVTPIDVESTEAPSKGTNLAVATRLLDADGNEVAVGEDTGDVLLSSRIETSLEPGIYYLEIEGAGRGDDPSGGFSDYASMGRYKILGNLPTQPLSVFGSPPSGKQDQAVILGDLSTSPVNGTDYGFSYPANDPIVHTFLLTNNGMTDLENVSVSLADGIDFEIVSAPGTTIPVGASAFMSIAYDPLENGVNGVDTDTVTINYNAPEPVAFVFALGGTSVKSATRDNYEANNAFDRATDLTNVEDVWLSDYMGPAFILSHPVDNPFDFYDIQVERGELVTVDVSYDAARAPITFVLRNAQNMVLGSTSLSDGKIRFLVPEDYHSRNMPLQIKATASDDSVLNPYDLRWSSAPGLGGDDFYEENDTREQAFDLTGAFSSRLSEFLGNGVLNDEDWYKIEIPRDPFIRMLYVRADFVHAEGDINIEIFPENDGSPEFFFGLAGQNEDYEVLTYFQNVSLPDFAENFSPTGNQNIMGVEPGTYFIRVSGDFAGNEYDLIVEPRQDDSYEIVNAANETENDGQTNPYLLGEEIVGKWLSEIDGIGASADYGPGATQENFTNLVDFDWYRFTVPQDVPIGELLLDFQSIIAETRVFRIYNANFELLEDNFITEGGVTTLNDEGTLSVPSPGGNTFFINVVPESEISGLAPYDFRIRVLESPPEPEDPVDDNYEENDRFDRLHDLRDNAGQSLAAKDGFGVNLDQDWYEIAVPPGAAQLKIELTFDGSLGDMNMSLWRKNSSELTTAPFPPPDSPEPDPDDPDGEVPEPEEVDSKSIVWDNPTGAFAIQISGNNLGNKYNLFWDYTLSEDAYEENDTRATAFDLTGHEKQLLDKLDGPGVQADEDWYRITATAGTKELQVISTFSDAEGDIDMELYDAAGNLFGRSTSSTDNEAITLLNPPVGDYYVKLYFGNGGNEYDLWWGAFSQEDLDGIQPDAYEPDNSSGAATALPPFTSLADLEGLATQTDVDWWAIDVSGSNSGFSIDCSFTHAEGDIDIEVIGPDGSVVVFSDSQTDNEIIDYNAPLPVGTYFIRVYGANLGNAYDLFWVENRDDAFEENDSFETAADITELRQVRLSETDIPTQGDDDWYRVTAEEANSILLLELTHTETEGSIFFEIHDDNNVPLASDLSNEEVKRLQFPLPSTGDFFIRVFGDNAYNEYDLFWNALPEDAFEENDLREDAYDISAEEGVNLEGVVFDDDWFVLDPPAGAVAVDLTLDFVHAFGDTDVNVYNQFGELIEVAFSVTDGETLRFDVNPFEGVAYIEVFGFDGNFGNPYTLNWVSDTKDGHEDNDTLGTATDLTQSEGIPLSESSDGFGTSGDEDWYVIQPSGANLNVYARFIHADGDIDIELFTQNGIPMERAVSDTDDELITTTVTPGDIYYIRVFGETAGNPYDLVWNSYDSDDSFEENDTLATASDFVSSEFESQFDLLQIDEDWYEVEVQAGEGLFVAEIFPFARVDEIVLGLHDAGGTLVESVATAEGETRLENASLAAGTYFLRITGKNLGGGYALAWSSGNEDNYEENDALVDAYDLTANPSTPLSLIDGPGAQYDEDWFSVTLAEDDSAITAKLDFQHDLGDLDLFLINEDAEILESSIGTSDNETISLSGLAAGTYYLQVVGTNLGNEYDLSWSAFADDNYEENDDFSESFALGGATSGTLSPIDGPGVRGSDDDYYALSIPFGHVSLEVTATFAHAEGDIALELFDGQQSSLVSSDSGTDDESVFTAVDPNGGTIFVLVSGANETGAEYDLTWSFGTVDSYEDNDTTANATDLTSDEGKLLSESMGYATQGDSDFYRVTLPANSLVLNVDVFFSHNLGNIDVNIHDSIPSVIASADSITDNETLSVPVDPAGGDYFIEVTGANTGNHYDLIWSVDVDDPYEENDSETETHDLAGAENVRLSDDLGLGKQFDEDWYSLTTPVGKISLNVLVDGFSAINGNIDLELYDAADVLVASSADGISSEEIQIAVDPAGETFKVKVFGDNEGNSYDLVWSTSTTDQYEENDFVEDFYDLSDQEGVWLSSVNGLATQADDDWYQIVVSPGATKLTVECTFIHADGDIDLELYRLDPTAEAEKTDPDLDQRKPTLVERKISETDNEEITDFDVTDRPGIYFIRVYFGNAGNAYNLRWFDEDDGDIPVIDIDGDSLFLDEDWFFGESSNSLLDARLLTPLANEDGDDFQNWAEYAFDLDTSIADTVVVDNSRQEIDGKIYFTISFIRKAEADVAGYRFFVEESHDLNFDGSHLAVEDAVVPLDNGLERVTFRSSREISEIPNCFFRIRVEPPAKSY